MYTHRYTLTHSYSTTTLTVSHPYTHTHRKSWLPFLASADCGHGGVRGWGSGWEVGVRGSVASTGLYQMGRREQLSGLEASFRSVPLMLSRKKGTCRKLGPPAKREEPQLSL